MGMDDRAKKWREIKSLSDDQIHENLAKKIWNPETEEIVERELRNREQQRTLESFARSAATSEKAAQANQHTAEATVKLVRATWGLFAITVVLVLVTIYTSAVVPACEKKMQANLFIKTLKHSLPSIRAELQQNIKMIEANQKIMSDGSSTLNGLFTLEEPKMDDVVKYVKDTNVIISINNVRECVRLLNQKIRERNNIYQALITNSEADDAIGKIITPKEVIIKSTAERCLSTFDRTQKELDQIHVYKVQTDIK